MSLSRAPIQRSPGNYVDMLATTAAAWRMRAICNGYAWGGKIPDTGKCLEWVETDGDNAGCKEISGREYWGGRRESNPQQPEPQSGALPVELLPPDASIITGSGGTRETLGFRLLGFRLLGSRFLALGFLPQTSSALLWLNAEC